LKNFDNEHPLDPASEILAVTSIPATLPKDVTAGEGPDKRTPALHFTTKSTFAPPSPPELQVGKPFSIAAWVFLPGGDAGITVASQVTTQRGAQSDDDDDQPANTTGWKIDVGGRVPSLKLMAGKSSIVVRGSNVERITPKAWTHLTFTYDGSGGQNGLSLYVNGKAVTNESDGGGNVELKGDFRNAAPLRLGGGAIAEFRVFNRELRQEEAQILASWGAIREAASKPRAELPPAEREALRVYYLNRADGDYMKLAGEMASLEVERRAIRRRAAITHVMQERAGTLPKANILFRGQYDQPRDEVPPAAPSVLPPMAASLPRNRLGLAQWLVDPSNPLMARVTVNRFWQEIFGTGLVKTAEDFGS